VVLRVVIGVVLVLVAIAVAFVIERRRRPSAPVRDAYPVPRQLYRADFPRPDAPWLVALFSSSTCDSCAAMRERVRGLELDDVAVVDVEFSAERDIHERYAISGVPMVLIADAEGVVRESFVGPATTEELATALRVATGSG
jgi:Thioredoxin